ncbi:MAG: ABC transporter ATP-binding protein [Candidatus Aphodomorpha sp.]
MRDQTILSVKDLEVFYGGIQALHGVSLEVNVGEIISIIGANGAGKSTLLKTIAGDQPIGKGTIRFEGKPLPAKVHQFSEIGISLVPEGRRIFVNLSVYENLLVGAYHVRDKKVIEQRLQEVYELFPRLHERRRQISGSLSGGEQQMLAVGRAMMAGPKLMMLDEPSMGLAPIIIDEMFDRFKTINKQFGTTMLIVEQNAELALEVSNRAYIMSVGKIVNEGASEELLHDSSIQEAYLGFSK